MGGSDQWGNIVGGVELGRRIDGRTLFGLTTPLVTTASGAKMGKTAQGAVWLNAERLSPYEYWQFWRNTEDADVGRFLRLFTELPLAEIARLEALGGSEINEAKKILATEATALVPRPRGGRGGGGDGARGLRTAAAAATTCRRPRCRATLLERGVAAFELFSRAGLAASNSEARRLISGGGARINDTTVDDETRISSARRSRARGRDQAQRRPQAPRPCSRGLTNTPSSSPFSPDCSKGSASGPYI